LGNTANGYRSLLNNKTGDYNVAMGYVALDDNSNASNNTAIGSFALDNNISGSNNVAIGYQALELNTTGYANLAVGDDANTSMNNLSYATAIGSHAIVNASYKVVIGNTNVTSIGGYEPWSNFSDGRFKENIRENVPGLEFITRLRPVTYTLNTQKIDEHLMQMMPDSVRTRRMQDGADYAKSGAVTHTGFVAQEVEQTLKEIGYTFDGVYTPTNPTDNYSLAYGQFVVPLVKAVQELAAENAQLKTDIEEMKAELRLIKEKLGLK